MGKTKPYDCESCGIRVTGYRITISRRGKNGFRHNICMDCAKNDLIEIVEKDNSKGRIDIERKDTTELDNKQIKKGCD